MKKVFALQTLFLLWTITGWAQNAERLPVYQSNNDAGQLQPLPNFTHPQGARQRIPAGTLLGRTSLATLTTGTDILVNNNNGASTTAFFTQSETSMAANGSTVVIGFNDAGSNAGGTTKFTGFAYSHNGGATFTDGGSLPTSAGGDAGDPQLAINNTTGRVYFATLNFVTGNTVQIFRSDDNGVTWLLPVNGTPGGNDEDKPWITVDNFTGPGNGNVYLMSRRFGGATGMYFYRSLDNGNTFGAAGILLTSAPTTQGAFVVVASDHTIYAFWYEGTTLKMRKSADLGLTFGSAITVASGLVGGVNGDLSLTGIRQGTASPSSFRSSEFLHAAVNPVSGVLYVTYANNPSGADKADIFLVRSTDNGNTWTVPERVNDDATLTDQWLPTIAVTPDGLNVGIFYYSRQEDVAGNNLFKYYGRIGTATGLGVIFSPSFPISDVASLPEFGRDAIVNSVYMGDYNQAVGTLTGFHIVWSDNRDDLPGGAGRKDPNIYYDFVQISEPVAPTEFYTKATGDLHVLSTWGSNPDGSGPNPSDFGFGKTFHLANRGGFYQMTGNWTVQGTLDIPFGSRLVINAFDLTIAQTTGAGSLFGSPVSNLTVSSLVHSGIVLFFDFGGNMLNNFTMERGGSSTADQVFVNADLEIYGIFNIVSGGPFVIPPPRSLILKSNAANTARVAPVEGSIVATVVVERYIPARRAWRILSAPILPSGQTINQAWQEGTTNASPFPNPSPGFGTHITGGPIFGSVANGFDQNPGAATSIKWYNSAVDNWVAQPNTNATPVSDKAWMIFIRGDRGIPLSTNNVPPTPTTLRSKGNLKIGDQVFTVNATGFTAIGNPFASPVDFATMPKTNVQQSMYLWDPKMGGANGVGAYVNVSFNGSGWDVTPAPTSPESQFVQNGQGFLVKTISSAIPGTLTIREIDKSATPNMDVFRVARNSGSFRINLNSVNSDHTSDLLDEVFSSYSASFSDKVNEMDAEKIPNMEENLAIIRGHQNLMVDRRTNLKNEDAINLRMWNLSQKDYELHFVPDHLTGSVHAWLVDNYLKTVTPIKSDVTSKYGFTITSDAASARSDRFKVVISDKKPQVVDVIFSVRAYPNPLEGKNLRLEFVNADNGNYTIKIVNTMGQLVFEKNISYTGSSVAQDIQLNKNLAKGIYQVTVINGNKTTSIPLMVSQIKKE